MAKEKFEMDIVHWVNVLKRGDKLHDLKLKNMSSILLGIFFLLIYIDFK